jgi:hypothetical protein
MSSVLDISKIKKACADWSNVTAAQKDDVLHHLAELMLFVLVNPTPVSAQSNPRNYDS